METILRHMTMVTVIAGLAISPDARATFEGVPVGIYATTIAEQDIPAFFPQESAELLIGDWQIEFTENGIAFVTKDGERVVTTRYHSNPARLILQDQEGRLACVPPRAGVFEWLLQDNVLTITEVQDTCAGRALVLTAYPLQKVQ